MSDDLRPAPLVTAEVDIAGLDGFMLNVQRLFASELWALSTGDEFKAALGLWGRAWQQSPPGSLPNEERVLAAFSGAGRDWKRVRGMALRGFVECSDGRLYHRVLCEDVLNAHRKRQQFRERTKNATEARRQRNVQRDDDRNVVDDADVTSVQGQGQGHKKEASSLRSEDTSDGAPPPRQTEPSPKPKPFPNHPFPDDAFDRWYTGYPHKVGRAAAEKAFAKVRKADDTPFEALITGRDRYIQSKPADRCWCNPATWLNEQRWLDQPAGAFTSAATSDTASSTDPRVDLGGGLTAPHSAIRSVWSKGRWLPDWGPAPDQPGCRIPAETMSAIMRRAA